MFEYRTLSSAMMSSKELLELIYNQVVKATDAFNSGLNLPDATYVQVAINNSDVKLAESLINSYNILSNNKRENRYTITVNGGNYFI